MDSCRLDNSTRLVVSGGDDGSLSILCTQAAASTGSVHVAAPLLINRTHASAVTACAILKHGDGTYVLTSGNDQWIRLWRVDVRLAPGQDGVPSATSRFGEGVIEAERLGKIKTNVADVSSMAVLDDGEAGGNAKVLICGVGMEVVRLEWERVMSS